MIGFSVSAGASMARIRESYSSLARATERNFNLRRALMVLMSVWIQTRVGL